MSDGMPGQVARGVVLHLIEDKLLNDPVEGPKLLARLKNTPTLAQTITDMGNLGELDPAIADHLTKHLLGGPPDGYWPQVQHKDGIIREALILALESAMGRPIQCYWICAGHYFQVTVGQGASQLTLLFLTPPLPPGLLSIPTDKLEEFWVVADAAHAQTVYDDGAKPVKDPNAPGGQRPRTPGEKPILTPTGTPEVSTVQLRRALQM